MARIDISKRVQHPVLKPNQASFIGGSKRARWCLVSSPGPQHGLPFRGTARPTAHLARLCQLRGVAQRGLIRQQLLPAGEGGAGAVNGVRGVLHDAQVAGKKLRHRWGGDVGVYVCEDQARFKTLGCLF
jgi:hypothetical protein